MQRCLAFFTPRNCFGWSCFLCPLLLLCAGPRSVRAAASPAAPWSLCRRLYLTVPPVSFPVICKLGTCFQQDLPVLCCFRVDFHLYNCFFIIFCFFPELCQSTSRRLCLYLFFDPIFLLCPFLQSRVADSLRGGETDLCALRNGSCVTCMFCALPEAFLSLSICLLL